MKRIAIFASGSGSNAENIGKYFNKNTDIEVALILSNKPGAYVLERAKKLKIPSILFTKDQLNDGETITSNLRDYKIDFIILAGFLLKMPESIIRAYPNKIINIHPALLPKFGGKGMYGHHVHKAVIESGESKSGITIHYINEYYDEGQIIFQAECLVEHNDSAEKLAQKIHTLEHQFFPEVIAKTILKAKD